MSRARSTSRGKSNIKPRTSNISVGATHDAAGRVVAPGRAKPVNFIGEAFDGARAGGYRGWMFLPSLDTSKQTTPWSRMNAARKAIWGYNFIPEVRAFINGLAIDETDTALWPRARTSNPAFNTAVTDRFHEENKDPRTFDLRQVDNVYSGQFLIRRTLGLIGDMFGQLVRPPTDPTNTPFRVSPPPRLGFLPGYQCTSADAMVDDPDLRDGIRFDPATAAAAKYRFAQPRRRDSDIQKYTELDAADVLHFHDPFFADEIRGKTRLEPFIRQMFSMDDIDRAETSGQVLRSRIAYAIETVGADDVVLPKLPGVTDTEVITNPDGSKTVIQKIVSRDGTEVEVFIPPTGMKMRTVESNRGGAIDFRNSLARGLVHCTPYPPEWVLFISGLAQGTVTRVVQNRVQKIVTFFRAMQMEMQLIERWYPFWLWKRIVAGLFDKVEGGIPLDWWKRKIQYPADLSVDVGRELRIFYELVIRGWMSPEDFHAKFGRDAEEVDKEILDSSIRKKKLLRDELAKKENQGIELKYEEVWPPPIGTQQQPQAPALNTNNGDGSTLPKNGAADRLPRNGALAHR